MSQAQQQQQQTQQKPQPGTPEYMQQMADLYENQNRQGDPTKQSFRPQPQTPQKPEWLPEKFWDAEKGEARFEQLAKSYAELERARSQKPQQQPQQKPSQGQQTTDAQSAVDAADLNWDDLGQKLVTKGSIDDGDYAALEKVGIPRNVVDTYVSAVKLAAEAARKSTADYVGGEDVLNHILTRAGAELSPEEIDAFNKMLANDKTAKSALDVLKARFAPSDEEPSGAIFGDAGPSAGMVGFSSQFEMTEAINKRNERGQRLYDVDPAYRAQVRRRIALTK